MTCPGRATEAGRQIEGVCGLRSTRGMAVLDGSALCNGTFALVCQEIYCPLCSSHYSSALARGKATDGLRRHWIQAHRHLGQHAPAHGWLRGPPLARGLGPSHRGTRHCSRGCLRCHLLARGRCPRSCPYRAGHRPCEPRGSQLAAVPAVVSRSPSCLSVSLLENELLLIRQRINKSRNVTWGLGSSTCHDVFSPNRKSFAHNVGQLRNRVGGTHSPAHCRHQPIEKGRSIS